MEEDPIVVPRVAVNMGIVEQRTHTVEVDATHLVVHVQDLLIALLPLLLPLRLPVQER